MNKNNPMPVLLAVLKWLYQRTHRLIEQDKFDDFEMLEDLHSEWYWQAEREEVLEYLKQVMSDEEAEAVVATWHQEFDEDYAEAAGLPEEGEDDD